MTAASQRRRGIHFGWLFLGAAVLGIALGTLLSRREDAKAQQALDEAARQAEALLPQGEAVGRGVFLPGRKDAVASIDPYAPDPRAIAGIPPYPNALPRALISGAPTVQGAPTSIAWFETTDSVDAVVSYYEQAFAISQFTYVSHRESERVGYAGYINPTTDGRITRALLHLVTAVQQGEHTLVLVSASTPGLMLEDNANLPPGVVFPPGAVSPQVLDLTEFGQARTSVFARAENTNLQDVVDWYGKHFEAEQWTVLEKNVEDPRQTSMTVSRGGASQVLQLRPATGGVEIVISYQNRAEAAPNGESP